MKTEKPIESLLDAATIKQIYLHGHKRPELISPDFLARPNARRVQLDLFYDCRRNVERYPEWQAFLRSATKDDHLLGQDDIFFTREGGEPYLNDDPHAEMHRLESGHFVVEDHLAYIVEQSPTTDHFSLGA